MLVIMNGLTDKYARLLGRRKVVLDDVEMLESIQRRLQSAQAQLETLDADLAAVAQTAALFDPTFEPSAIMPIRPQVRSHPVAAHSYIRATLRVLRNSEDPLTASEITDQVHIVLGLPDRSAWKTIRASLQGSMQRYADRGLIEVHAVKPLRYSLRPVPA